MDLRGIPWRDGTDRTRWAPPAFLPPSDDPGRWLINLEELPSAVPMVQAALYQLVLDRKVGEYELPEGASLIACGNCETVADALIKTHGQDGTEWLGCGGRAKVERGVAGWRAAIGDGTRTDRPEDILVLRVLRRVEHAVELAGDARIEPRIRAIVDEDRHGRRRGGKARIGEVCVSDVQRCTPATLRALAIWRSFLR